MKRLFTSFFILLTVNGLWAQADTLWTKTFGGSQYDNANSVQQTRDGGYIITGKTNFSGNGSGEVGLLKIGKYSDSVWHVSIAGSDSNDGSENSPFATIQKGIASSSDGDTVLVAAGTYKENINYNGKNIVVGSLFLTTQDTSYISSTIIDGNQSGSVVTFEKGEDTTAVLSGFSITNGSAGYGGGIIASDSSSPLLNNLIIQSNNANSYGGGIYLYTNSDAIIRNTVISGNTSSDDGGGINCNNSNPSLENVTITNNSAPYGGGMMITNTSNPSLENVTITSNTASDEGGGIRCSNSNPSLENVTITGNSAVHGGGAFFTVSNAILVNCILWNNEGNEQIYNSSGTVTATYSDIQGGWEGTGNIDADPIFADTANGNYHLLWNSPCINAGNPDLDGDGTDYFTDTDDQDPDGTRMDMGAYYLHQYKSPLADFTATPTSGQVPLEVQFTDQSVPMEGKITNWTWNFGDGSTSTDEDPIHTYDKYGVYTVSLTVVDDNSMGGIETKEDYITVNYAGPVWYVSNDGDDTGQGTIDDPFENISNAVYLASSGDTIFVYEGIYTEITSGSSNELKHLFIASIHYPNIDSTTIQNTQLQHIDWTLGSDIADKMEINGFYINGDESNFSNGLDGNLHSSFSGQLSDTLYIDNCHMQNFQYGSGANISDDVIAKFQNCIFENNFHGISSYNSDIIVIDSKINNNDAENENGSAIMTNHYDRGSITLINTEISNNIGNNTIYISYNQTNNTESLVMDNVQIENNEGSGIWSSGYPSGQNILNNVTINNNTGIGIENLYNATISNCSITNNKDGGIWGSSLTIENTLIKGNISVTHEGGGIGPLGGTCTLSNVIIKDNSCPDCFGGGLYFGNNQDLILLEDVTITNNHAKNGGGIYMQGDTHNIEFSETEKCNIYENYALIGTDIYMQDDILLNVIVDTFTVTTPTDYYAYPNGYITFDIENHSVDPIIGDIYVDPAGSNDNSGTSPASPYKTISYAMLSAFANSSNPATIHLNDGTYSPSTNGEYFPLGGKQNVSISGNSQEGTILNGDSLTSIFHFEDVEDVTISGLTITNGIANRGGLYNDGGGIFMYNSSPTISNIIIKDNTAVDGGGGMCIYTSPNPTISNVIIKGNTSSDGGGMIVINSSPHLSNLLITENQALNRGGGIHFSQSNSSMINVTLSGNIAGNGAASFSCWNSSNIKVINSILWNNSSEEIHLNYGDITIENSDVYGGQGSVNDDNGTVNWLAGNLDVDPLFVDSLNGDYHLKDQSLLIGAGIDSIEISDTWYYAPSTDITGNKRPNPSGSKPDIGAYENQYGEPQHNTFIYVSKIGTDSETTFGFSSDPFKTIQAGIDYSWDGDTVFVHAGTYDENISLTKSIVLEGYNRELTIIDGGQNDRVVSINGDSIIFQGFTVQNGLGALSNYGGGIRVDSNNPNSYIVIDDCIITGNMDGPNNGGNGGGGIFVGSQATTYISNTIIRDNYGYNGGGIFASSEVILRNVLLHDNQSANNGGGIFVYANDDFSIFNSTIYNNTGQNGGGAYTQGIFNVENCIFYNNQITGGGCGGTGDGYQIQIDGNNNNPGTVNVAYSLIQGGEGNICNDQGTLNWNAGNIDADPIFANTANNDFTLTFYSPVINKGNPDFDGDGTTWENDTDDQDPDGTRMDMGAYYFDLRDTKPPTVNLTGPTVSKLKLGTKHNITWTTTDNFPTDTIKIKLAYTTDSGTSWEKIADTLSNTGSYEWSVPNIPSANGGIKITATDFGGNTAADSTGKIFEIYYPSVTLQSLSNTTVKISEQVPIIWDTASEPAVQSVDLYYTVDDGVNWKDLSLNENNDFEYWWSVPNEPTTTAGIRIIAKEQFGYADTAEVKGITIKIDYPTVTSVNPNQDNIWWDTKEIKFKTNIIFDPQTVNNNSVILTNSQADYGYSVTQSNDTITVKFASTLITYDSISIKLDASKIKSPYGYGLDGNGDGTPGDDYTIIRKVYMPIDYDYSGTITASDVSLFVDYFKSNDSKWEPAPIASGTVPYVMIAPDGKYDIEDMLTFVQFGNWYLQGASGKVADDIGNTPISLDTTIQSKDYTVSFSKSTKAIEVYVKYDPLKLTPIIEPTSGEIKLGHHDTEKGIISLIVYNPSGENIRLKWNQLDKKSESDISVLVKTTDQNGQETVKRTMLKVISVPSEFALHDNYPNPFNPTTTFRFDVPEVSDVTLSIYNMLGQRVRTFNYQNTSAGYHSVTWDATNDYGEQVGAGVYLYQLRAKQFVKTRKMVLLK